MAGDNEPPKVAPKGADFGLKPNRATNKKAALAVALRANLARRKAHERALRQSAQAKDERSKTDSEG